MKQYLITIVNYEDESYNNISCLSKAELASIIANLKEDDEIEGITIFDSISSYAEWMSDNRTNENGWQKQFGI